jgi:hypothetical protein
MALLQHPLVGDRHEAPLTCRGSLVLLLALTAWLLSARAGLAQSPTDRVIYSRQSVFRIPFDVDPGERRLREVRLYYSEDQGRTWRKFDAVAPSAGEFRFRAERDGLHWFTTQTQDLEGRLYPQTLQQVKASQILKVVIDTQPPSVALQARPAREGLLGVEWDIRDDNLDLSSFILEYRSANSADWTPLPVSEPTAYGERFWSPGTNGPVEVRLRVRDLAKNEGEAKLTLNGGGQDLRTSRNGTDSDGPRSYNRSVPATQHVNNKRISLNYEIKEEGPSGVSSVELWATTDGREWKMVKADPTHQPPMVYEAPGEGVYGFTLVVKSGVGLSERPPRAGDAPQVWVEVDLTKPVVQWVAADVGRGLDTGKLTITWKATDKKDNLAREPITLSYAKDEQGPWTQIAANLENTGQYIWRMPPGVPYKFLVKAEAVDKAGNSNSNVTSAPVLVDLAQPKGLILGVGPAGKQGSDGSQQ